MKAPRSGRKEGRKLALAGTAALSSLWPVTPSGTQDAGDAHSNLLGSRSQRVTPNAHMALGRELSVDAGIFAKNQYHNLVDRVLPSCTPPLPYFRPQQIQLSLPVYYEWALSVPQVRIEVKNFERAGCVFNR